MGQIFGYFGDGEPPPFPPFPEPARDGLIDHWPVYRVPCNYLQCFENSMDEVHVAFTHAPGGSHAKLSADLPVITAKETDWGILRFGTRASGKVRHTLHYAPNMVRVIVPPLAGLDGAGGWPEINFSFTPVDDESCLWLITSKVFVTGEDGRDVPPETRRVGPAERAAAPPVQKVVDDLWSGQAPLCRRAPPRPRGGAGHRRAGRAGPHRGPQTRVSGPLRRGDHPVAPHSCARELSLIAEDRPAKRWSVPPADVVPTLGF